MRFGKIGFGLIIGLAMFFLPLLAQTTVEEHWSPYAYPREIPEGVPHHIVVDGDTFWALAGQYLGDPLLWPQLYQLNSYIVDPDLIYPGDPILMNVGVVVNDASIAQSVEGQDGNAVADGSAGSSSGTNPEGSEYSEVQEFSEASEGSGENQSAEDNAGGEQVADRASTDLESGDFDSEFVILPAGSRSDMECSTYIYQKEKKSDALPFDFLIAGSENRFLTQFSFGDILYLNKGTNAGVQPGELYSVRRILRDVHHPDGTKKVFAFSQGRKYLGTAIDQVGVVRIVAVQEKNATAMVTANCGDLKLGDFLVPFEQEPIPLITELPVIDRWKKINTEGSGTIVLAEDDLASFGTGSLCSVDLGIDKNIAPGDLFLVYRKNPNSNTKKGHDLPDIYLGYAVALRVVANTTVVRVINTHTSIAVGDRVVPYASQNTSF